MEALRLSFLGGFKVERGGEVLSRFESDKARALLVYLAVKTGPPHRRDELAGLLWPEKPENHARHSLSQTLSSLKMLLSANPVGTWLEITPQVVHLKQQHCQVDVLEFDALLQACEAHGHSPQWACRACLERLERADALYQGDFLEGFSLEGCEDFEEWLLLQRETLRQRMLSAAGTLSHLYELQDETEKALQYVRRQVELDPLDEAAYRQVMRLLTKLGRRLDALALYETCRSILREELAVEPEAETTALYRRIQAEPDSKPIPSIPPHNLPAPLTHFVGREEELEQLCLKLADPTNRLVTILGFGGVGKTRLALEAGREMLPVFPDGVFLAELDTQQSRLALAPAIAEAVGLGTLLQAGMGGLNPLSIGGKEIEERLFPYFQAKNLLLILDGFENMLHEVDLIHRLLRRSSFLKILITSRARLNLEVEHIFLVSGLSYPTVNAEEDLRSYSSVQLFGEVARRADPRFELNEENRLAVADICRLTLGIPLGILLAASWAGTLEPAQISQEIHSSLDLFSSDWHDLPDRQRSLRATFDHSWWLLGEADRIAFLYLSIFHGPFKAERANEVTAASLLTLRTLIHQSMLLQASEGRYLLHDLLRQYAQEKLAALPEENLFVHERHCQVFLQTLADWQGQMRTSRLFKALGEIDQEYADVMVAWEWALTHGEMDLLEKTGDALYRYHSLRCRFTELGRVCKESMDTLEKTPLHTLELRLWIRLATWRVKTCVTRHEKEQGWQVIQQVEDRLQGQEAFFRRMAADMAQFFHAKGDLIEMGDEDRLWALKEFEQGLASAYTCEDGWEIPFALIGVGGCYAGMGQYKEMGEYAEKALTFPSARQDPYLYSQVLVQLGNYYWMLGDYDRGLKVAEEHRNCLKELTENWNQELNIGQISLGLFHAGQWKQARPYYDKLVEYALQTGDHVNLVRHLFFIDCIDNYTGHYTSVVNDTLFQEIILTETERDNIGIAKSGSYLAIGDYAQAEVESRRYIKYMRSLPRLDIVGYALVELAYSAYQRGNNEDALHHLQEAMENAVTYRFYDAINLCLAFLALLFARAGEVEWAIELYATVTTHPVAANSKWYEDLFGKHIATLAKDLPVDIMEAARAHGRCGNLAAAREYLIKIKQDTPLLERLLSYTTEKDNS